MKVFTILGHRLGANEVTIELHSFHIIHVWNCRPFSVWTTTETEDKDRKRGDSAGKQGAAAQLK